MEDDNNYSTTVSNNSSEELVRIQIEQPTDVDCHDRPSSEAPIEGIGEDNMKSGSGFGDASANGRSVFLSKKSPSRIKLDSDKQEWASNRV